MIVSDEISENLCFVVLVRSDALIFSTFVANNEEKCDTVFIFFVLLQSENGYGRPLT